MIPWGLGSGFEGGVTAPNGGVTINMRRMNQVVLTVSGELNYSLTYYSLV